MYSKLIDAFFTVNMAEHNHSDLTDQELAQIDTGIVHSEAPAFPNQHTGTWQSLSQFENKLSRKRLSVLGVCCTVFICTILMGYGIWPMSLTNEHVNSRTSGTN